MSLFKILEERILKNIEKSILGRGEIYGDCSKVSLKGQLAEVVVNLDECQNYQK